jgi:hypothetical protein
MACETHIYINVMVGFSHFCGNSLHILYVISNYVLQSVTVRKNVKY